MIRINGVRFENMTLVQKLVTVMGVVAFLGLFILALPFVLGLIGALLLIGIGVLVWFNWKARKLQAQMQAQMNEQFTQERFTRSSTQDTYEFDQEEVVVHHRRQNRQDLKGRARPDFDNSVIDVTDERH